MEGQFSEKGYTVRGFSCVRDGLTIRGYEYLPEGADVSHDMGTEQGGVEDGAKHALPIFIASHGFGGCGKHMEEYCTQFAKWGYAAYCYDFCGGCVVGASDGKTTDMTISTECADLCAVIDYAKALPYTDAGHIILLGASQGGYVSSLVAAKRPDEIRTAILIYPALCIPDDARRGGLAGASYDVNDVPDILDCWGMKLGRGYHDDVVERNPYEEINAYTGPVLLIHGMEDTVVNYNYAINAQRCYAPGQCHLQLIKHAGHGFWPELTKSVLVSIRQFLLGRKEVITVDVTLTGSEVRRDDGNGRQVAVLFNGTGKGKYFEGTIMPGAEDLQTFEGDRLVSMCADYTLEGRDCNGDNCYVHIVNRNTDGEWKPTVDTDSAALSFLNGADLTAALEMYEGGLTVRIYADMPKVG